MLRALLFFSVFPQESKNLSRTLPGAFWAPLVTQKHLDWRNVHETDWSNLPVDSKLQAPITSITIPRGWILIDFRSLSCRFFQHALSHHDQRLQGLFVKLRHDRGFVRLKAPKVPASNAALTWPRRGMTGVERPLKWIEK